MAIKVALRQKQIKNGRKSLFLDFYPAIPNPKTGKSTRREFLGLYIIEKPKTPIDKQHNSETLEIAKSIRQKRENFLNKPEIYSQYEKDQLRTKELGEQCFITYFRKLVNKKKGSTKDSWISALNYLETFTSGELKFENLNQKLLEDFKDYLLNTKSKRSDKSSLSQNSASSYFNKIKASLKQAYKDEILQTDLNSKIKPIKEVETRKEFLTLEELNDLLKTPFNYDVMKRAAIFSAITGMAFKEIQNMIWKDITFREGEGYMILTKRQKSGRDNYLPISKQAYNLTGGKNNLTDLSQANPVFEGLKYSDYHNRELLRWVEAAGIKKHITFHCFRHSYATLQLINGTEIYTVSKMLGHKNVKTTQVYAKIVDETKRKASDKIKLDF